MIVRALGHHAEPLADRDQRELGQRGAVGGGEDQDPVVRQRTHQPADERGRIGDMLDHFHRHDQIEPFAAQILDAAGAIIDRQPLPLGMKAGGRDILGRGVQAGHLRTQTRQRLRQQARAAADIECLLARQRPPFARIEAPDRVDLCSQIAQTRRIQPVQHRRRAPGIPPVGGELAEKGGFGGVDRGAGDGHGRALPSGDRLGDLKDFLGARLLA